MSKYSIGKRYPRDHSITGDLITGDLITGITMMKKCYTIKKRPKNYTIKVFSKTILNFFFIVRGIDVINMHIKFNYNGTYNTS